MQEVKLTSHKPASLLHCTGDSSIKAMVIGNHQLNNDMLPQVDPLSVNGRDPPMSICQCRSHTGESSLMGQAGCCQLLTTKTIRDTVAQSCLALIL